MDYEHIKECFFKVKALEGVDLDKAIALVSDPELDGAELSGILQMSLDKNIVHKGTREPLTLHPEVMKAGLHNRTKQKFFEMLNPDE
jgi:hypothetical protein